MNHTVFFDALRAGQVQSCYLFEGTEEYIKQQAFKQLCAKLLPAGLEEMNLTDLTDPEADELIAAAETLPFMGERRVVAVRECPLLLSGRKAEDERKLEALTGYLELPAAHGMPGVLRKGQGGWAQKALQRPEKAKRRCGLLPHERYGMRRLGAQNHAPHGQDA